MTLRRIYPLAGMPRQSQLWSWISFDVANQSFTLIVNTLLFSIFFAEVVVRNPAIDDRLWALTYGSSMLLCAILSPLAGAIADERGWKKRCLLTTGVACSLLTCGLALVGSGQIWVAVLLYVPANFAFAIGENFLASFLPSLAEPNRLGRVSAFSWGCAYGAALLLLVITAVAMLWTDRRSPDQWRPFFVFAGVWFFVFLLPTWIWLREPPSALTSTTRPNQSLLAAGFVRLGESLRSLAKFRDLALLLVASLFYATGMSVVVFFASKLAAEYGFTQVKLILFIAVITVSGIIGTLLPVAFQDRAGHRRSTLFFLVIWIGTALGFAWYAHGHEAHPRSAEDPYPTWPLWLIGNLLGFGLGSLGSANRAFVGYLAPAGRMAETFGMWGLVFKLAAIMSFPFAWIKDTSGTPSALLVLAGFLLVGFLITLFVNEQRGREAAVGAGDGFPNHPTPVSPT